MTPDPSHMTTADGIWQGVHIAAGSLANPTTSIEDGAIVVIDGHVRWVGPRAELPSLSKDLPRFEARGALVTPGLIDCHTHLVYAGQRADEFAMRRAGASYEDIARAGGGILSTVVATRGADEATLLSLAGKRLQPLLAEGLCAIEIKSGYGLTLADERKQLRVARRLGELHGLAVKTTFLGAHALPPEYAGRPDDYIEAVCREMLPALAAEKLVDAVDVFCERIAFSRAQTERVFIAARELGIPVKLHAEQLSDMDGAALAAAYGALSCDHIEHLSAKGLAAMAAAGTVAVLLPGAFYALRETRCPPVVGLRESGVPIAVATDHNPGTSPALSLLLMMNMACTLFGLTVPEALAGVTRHAARALGLQGSHGVIAAGRQANFVVWDFESASELVYWIGQRPRCTTIRQGRIGLDGLGLCPSSERTP